MAGNNQTRYNVFFWVGYAFGICQDFCQKNAKDDLF